MTIKNVLIILFVSLLAACTTTADKPSDTTVVEKGSGSTNTFGSDGTGAQTYGADSDADSNMSELDPRDPRSVRIIYFDYDSSDIQAQFRDTVEAHATFLIAHPDQILSLEGHADERGSREYNLALGEGRSQTVKRQMVLLGASSSQIRTTSYGEERPVSEEHDDFAWSQNRRVEIIY